MKIEISSHAPSDLCFVRLTHEHGASVEFDVTARIPLNSPDDVVIFKHTVMLKGDEWERPTPTPAYLIGLIDGRFILTWEGYDDNESWLFFQEVQTPFGYQNIFNKHVEDEYIKIEFLEGILEIYIRSGSGSPMKIIAYSVPWRIILNGFKATRPSDA